MADTKISNLTANTTPASGDRFPHVDDPTGSAETKYCEGQYLGLTHKIDDHAAADDNTDLNVTNSAHGLCPKTPNNAQYFLAGDATWDKITWVRTGTIWAPFDLYDEDTQIMVFRAPAALTITRIHISGPNAAPTTELDIDLKWASDTTAWTDAAVIDVCDTTSGVVTITSGFDDATIASGKYVYWQFGADPHADWLWAWFEIHYTFD